MKNEVKNYLETRKCTRWNSPSHINYFYQSGFNGSFKMNKRAYQILKDADNYNRCVSKHEILREVFGVNCDRPGYHTHICSAQLF